METVLNGDTVEAQSLMERHIREIAQNVLANGLNVEKAA